MDISSGREGADRESDPSEGALERLARNLCSNSLTMRNHRLSITAVPSEYFEIEPRTPAQQHLREEIDSARVLQPAEFTFNLRESSVGVQESPLGNLLYEPSIGITAANVSTGIVLIDMGNAGFLAANRNHSILRNVPLETKADIQAAWMGYVDLIEERLNAGVEPEDMKLLALAQLQQHRLSITSYIESKNITLADPDADTWHKAHAEELKEGYVRDLKRTDVLVSLLEKNDPRIKIKFGITGRGYGTYTIRLKVAFEKSNPFTKKD